MCKSWYSDANKPVNMIIYIGKKKKVCNKTRSPPASLLFKGQGTEFTTVIWPIVEKLKTFWQQEKLSIKQIYIRNSMTTRLI